MRGKLSAILVCLVLMGITVYLIYFGDSSKPKVYPSQEAIERLNKVSDDFQSVRRVTEMKLELARQEAANGIVRGYAEQALAEFNKVRDENDSLKAYIKELEDALVYATEWMDRMMEVLDGR